jgi:predicted AlkP superfamily phosphohydrolase/phosphomutase
MIDSPPLWSYLDAQGVTSGIFHVPMSYPPVPVRGFMVAGGLASGWTNPEMPNFTSDASTSQLVSKVAGDHYPLDTVVSYENDWRSTTIATQLQRNQEIRNKVLGALIEEKDPQVVFAVAEGPDRLQHLHYQYIVETSDWYNRPEAAEARDRALGFFSELDKGIGPLAEWAGPDGHVLIVSDHGFGPWEKTLNINLLLEQWGFLALPKLSGVFRNPLVAGPGQRLARKLLPRRFLQSAKATVERGIKWNETTAFASHVAEQGIHVNERGRLPHGIVEAERTSRVTEELVDRLRGFTDPDDGMAVVDRIVTRSEVISGPHAIRSPDIFPFCRDQRYELSDTVAASSALTDHRDRPWGYHHVDGIFIGRGPGFKDGLHPQGLDIVDVLPTAFHAAGLAVPTGLDGRVATELMSAAAASRPIITTTVQEGESRPEEYPFSPDEERAIEESLRGLGYLE